MTIGVFKNRGNLHSSEIELPQAQKITDNKKGVSNREKNNEEFPLLNNIEKVVNLIINNPNLNAKKNEVLLNYQKELISFISEKNLKLDYVEEQLKERFFSLSLEKCDKFLKTTNKTSGNSNPKDNPLILKQLSIKANFITGIVTIDPFINDVKKEVSSGAQKFTLRRIYNYLITWFTLNEKNNNPSVRVDLDLFCRIVDQKFKTNQS
jgi:hypothetical protein